MDRSGNAIELAEAARGGLADGWPQKGYHDFTIAGRLRARSEMNSTMELKMMEPSRGRANATIVVAAADNGTIGRDNQLPWKLRSDLQRFKQITMGHALIMGRKTFESIGRVLPGRTTIVLSRSSSFKHPGVTIASSLEDAIDKVPDAMHPFIVGGSEVYRQAIPLVNRILLTRVLADIPGDAKLAEWDRRKWRLVDQQPLPQGPHDEWPTIFETWTCDSTDGA